MSDYAAIYHGCAGLKLPGAAFAALQELDADGIATVLVLFHEGGHANAEQLEDLKAQLREAECTAADIKGKLHACMSRTRGHARRLHFFLRMCTEAAAKGMV